MRPGPSPSKSAMVEPGARCPSRASRVGSTTSSPCSTSSAGGMSGCQRLWPMSGWSLSGLPRWISMTFVVDSLRRGLDYASPGRPGYYYSHGVGRSPSRVTGAWIELRPCVQACAGRFGPESLGHLVPPHVEHLVCARQSLQLDLSSIPELELAAALNQRLQQRRHENLSP